MENLQAKTDRELLEEIHANTRKTKNYLMWQLIITVVLVVLPILAMGLILPTVIGSLNSIYTAGLLQ